MNQFKFGDKVLCKWQGRTFEALFVEFWEEEGNPGWGWIEVLEEGESTTTDVGCDCVELIPHPDTVRLDWLEKNEIEDNWPLIEWDDYLGKWEVKYPDSKFSFEYLKDAIDFAISEEQADD